MLMALALTLLVVELGVRALRSANASVRALLYIPRLQTGYDDCTSTEELLDRTLIGHSPYANFCEFILNSRGFLSPEYTDRKAEGTYRVVAIGDSFTFKAGGVPFASQWTTLLQQRLEQRMGREVEMINLGMAGVGPRFEHRMWQLEARKLEPDLVVLGLFVGNDFTDEGGAGLAGIDASQSTRFDTVLRVSYTVRLVRNLWLLKHAQLETTAVREQHLAPASGAASERRGGYELPNYPEHFANRLPSFTEEAYANMLGWLMSLNLRSNRAGFERTFDSVAQVLRELAGEVEAAGSRLVVVVMPSEFQVDPDVRDQGLAVAKSRAEDYDFDEAQRDLAAFFAREGIDFVDLLPAFRERGASMRLYRLRDSHWNIAGNALAAEQIAEHLAPPK